jgi:hypothetical protein
MMIATLLLVGSIAQGNTSTAGPPRASPAQAEDEEDETLAESATQPVRGKEEPRLLPGLTDP